MIDLNECMKLAKDGRSVKEIAASSGVTYDVMRRFLEKNRIKTNPSKRTWSDSTLIEAVSSSNNYSDVLRFLGLNPKNAGNFKSVKTHINRLGLDSSHFYMKPVKQNLQKKKYGSPIESFLVQGSSITSSQLFRKLIKAGLKTEQCEIQACQAKDWLGEKLTFELDHINGDNTDNRLDNLRVLCPNCHSQTPTWRGRGRKSKQYKAVYNCSCGAEIDIKARQCLSCAIESRRLIQGINYPPIQQILTDYRNYGSLVALGKLYNVSDNSVKKHLAKNGFNAQKLKDLKLESKALSSKKPRSIPRNTSKNFGETKHGKMPM